jgi:hypothetical protein
VNRKLLIKFLSQTGLISLIYGLFCAFNLFKVDSFFVLINLFFVTLIFIVSGFILFYRLPDHEPIAWRFLIMTMIQLLSILSLELAFVYTNQSVELILHGLFFSLIHFLFQTIFLVRIQKRSEVIN